MEVCEEAICRAEEINPKLNAIITPMYDNARNTVKYYDTGAPFSGVPFLLKDVHHALKGYPMSSGSRLLKNYVPDYNAEIVTRFMNSGVVIIGKTNTPEFKLAYVTEPEAFGPTRNPWNTEYSSGGSSGGSAAAVAARIVPIASATDEGGSIRVPSSYCGVFGFKPGRGRNPVGPDFNEEWDGMSYSHIISRSVRDSAAMLDAVSGIENGSPYGTVKPEKPFAEEVTIDPGSLRIGYYTRYAYGMKPDAECINAVSETCRLLENLGHRVEEISPDYNEDELAMYWSIIMIGNETALVDKLVQTFGKPEVKNGLELSNYALYCVGRKMKALDFVKAKRNWRKTGLAMSLMMNRYDIILTPTLGKPPVLAGSLRPGKSDIRSLKFLTSAAGRILLSSKKVTASIMEELVKNTIKTQMPFTIIANITGQPAMSLPLYWSTKDLPIGVQFIGRYGDESELFRLAGQLERAKPWIDRKPPAS